MNKKETDTEMTIRKRTKKKAVIIISMDRRMTNGRKMNRKSLGRVFASTTKMAEIDFLV